MINHPLAFILDIDDTAYDQLVPFQNALNKHIDFPNENLKTLFLAYRQYSDAVFEATQLGQMSIEDMHIYRLTKALNDYGYNISKELALAIQHDYANEQKQIVLDKHIKELLQYCTKHNVPVGIITNGPTAHQWQKVKQLNLLQWVNKDNVLVSQEVGYMKPHPQIFKILEQRMNLTGLHTYYIGDAYHNDVVGAKQAKWKAIWLNVYDKTITNEYEPDIIVTNRELLYKQVKQIIDNNMR